MDRLDEFHLELEALKEICKQLDAVPTADQRWMLDYLWDRYVTHPRRVELPTPSSTESE